MNTLISSRENKLIKEYIKLRDRKAKRREEKLFVVEGARLSYDAALSGAVITEAFFTADARERYSQYFSLVEKNAKSLYEITENVAAALADTLTSQDIFCVVKIPDKKQTIENLDINGVYLCLENIQDPGNLGTILRTSEAMGINAVLLSDGCTDTFSPKVVRASMGAVFRLPVLSSLDMVNAVEALKAKGISVYAAVAKDGDDITKLNLSHGAAAVIGNEGNGLTDETIAACTAKATVIMRGRAESLNAAAAATVIIWEMTKNL